MWLLFTKGSLLLFLWFVGSESPLMANFSIHWPWHYAIYPFVMTGMGLDYSRLQLDLYMMCVVVECSVQSRCLSSRKNTEFKYAIKLVDLISN